MSSDRNMDRLPFQLMCLSHYAQELTAMCLQLAEYTEEPVPTGRHRG